MKYHFSVFLLLFATVLLSGCGGGEEDTESASAGAELSVDEQAFRALFSLEEDSALLAASEDFLRDHSDSPRRSFVLSNVFDLRAATDETGAVAWAREMLPRETSDTGKAALYGAMFGHAVKKGDRDAGLRIAGDFWELDLKASRTLNSIGWQLVEDTGWDPVLGGRMGEKAAGLVEGTERAMCLDTAGWGYFKADDIQGAERMLEEAAALLDEPDLEFTLHLKAVYEKLGAADKLLALIEKQLSTCVNRELRVKAEDIISRRGGDLKALDERIWAARMARSSVAPDFELSDMNNISMHLTDFGGKVLLVNFFYPTCPSCTVEFPHLIELSKKISNPDFALLAINTRESQKKLVREMVAEHGADWPILTDVDGDVGRLFGIRAVPTTLFIDREGRIIFKAVGFREGQEEDFELMINALLERGDA